MADLFTLTAPLLIRYPDGTREVMVERFRHPQGLLYFRPFWDSMSPAQGMVVVNGDIRGEGPWKVGQAVVTVLGCHGTDPEQAAEFAAWQEYLSRCGSEYPDRMQLESLARAAGCLP